MRHVEGGVEIRDSQNPDTVLRFTEAEWKAFQSGVENGEFDR